MRAVCSAWVIVLVGPLAVVSSACEVPVDAALLSVDDISPDRVEPGGRLSLEGGGFPPGHEGRLILTGRFHRPGAPTRSVRAVLAVQATSDQALTARFDDAAVQAFGGRGTFEGAVRVEFDAGDGDGVVSGHLGDVRLDVVPSTGPGLGASLALGRAGDELLETFGVTIDPEDDSAPGLAITEVQTGAPADLAGVVPGDRLVARGGLRVESVADLAPAPRARSVLLELARPTERQPLRVRLGLGVARTAEPAPEHIEAAAVAVALVLFVGLLFSPLGRVTSRLAAALGARRPGALSGLLDTGPVPRAGVGLRVARALWTALSVLAALTAFGAFPLACRFVPGGLDLAWLLAAVVGARLLAVVTSRTAGRSALRGIFDVLAFSLPVVTALGAVALTAGTRSLPDLSATQGGAPWEFRLFRDPVALIAFPAAFAAGLSSLDFDGESLVARVAERLRGFVVAAVLVALFLGGFELPYVDDPLTGPPLIRVLAVLAFSVKALVLSLLALRLRPAARSALWAPLWATPVGFSALGIALLASTVRVPAWLEAFPGPIALAALLALGLSLARVRWWPAVPQVEPFG